MGATLQAGGRGLIFLAQQRCERCYVERATCRAGASAELHPLAAGGTLVFPESEPCSTDVAANVKRSTAPSLR